MAFIYSRPRIRIPKILISNPMKPRKKRNKKKRIILVIVLMMVMGIAGILKSVIPIFNGLCLDKAKSIATLITNQETNKILQEYEYSDFVMVHKDEKGNIIMLESNMKNMNGIIAKIATNIQTSIDQTKNQDVSIHLGSFTGISFLAARGFQIPIRIVTAGNVKTTVKSELIDKGINQTLHRLYLEIECEINILTPFNNLKESIINQLLLAENVIVGNIPSSFYNIEGITENQALELVK